MRLDKYLKVTRLIKRRTVANEACDAEKIVVNGKVARASYDVKVGDIIEINMGTRPLKVKVLNVTEHATKENAADNYTVIDSWSPGRRGADNIRPYIFSGGSFCGRFPQIHSKPLHQNSPSLCERNVIGSESVTIA